MLTLLPLLSLSLALLSTGTCSTTPLRAPEGFTRMARRAPVPIAPNAGGGEAVNSVAQFISTMATGCPTRQDPDYIACNWCREQAHEKKAAAAEKGGESKHGEKSGEKKKDGKHHRRDYGGGGGGGFVKRAPKGAGGGKGGGAKGKGKKEKGGKVEHDCSIYHF